MAKPFSHHEATTTHGAVGSSAVEGGSGEDRGGGGGLLNGSNAQELRPFRSFRSHKCELTQVRARGREVECTSGLSRMGAAMLLATNIFRHVCLLSCDD
jgi:hypothetical protein